MLSGLSSLGSRTARCLRGSAHGARARGPRSFAGLARAGVRAGESTGLRGTLAAKTLAPWQPSVRRFAGGSGKGYQVPEGGKGSAFPDSWVEPDALYEFAEATTGEPVDEAFTAEFGRRNQHWRKKVLKESPELFDSIGQGQAPKYFWIGCCDSRVAAETMIQAKPGEIFVHRNIANMVVSTDTNLRAALKFAVEYLKVQHIIVCGHYDCGGLKAASSKHDHSAPLENWLTNIRDVVRLHQDELEAIVVPEERHKRLVELNVIEQCLNLFKTGDVQRRRAETGSRPDEYECAYPRIHGMVFSPSDGILRKLPIDFSHYLKKYKNVYQMYDAADFPSSGTGAP